MLPHLDHNAKQKNEEEKIRLRKEALNISVGRNSRGNSDYDITSILAEADKYYEWLIAKMQ